MSGPYQCDFCGSDYTTRACCDNRYAYLTIYGHFILPPSAEISIKREALLQIRHSINQICIPGNDVKREISLIRNIVDQALTRKGDA